MRNNCEPTKEPLSVVTITLLRRKYVERQLRTYYAEKMRKMVQSTIHLKQDRYKQDHN